MELYTIKQFVERHPWLTKRALENQIYQADYNGLTKFGVIVKVGRKVLIDGDRYTRWLESQRVTA